MHQATEQHRAHVSNHMNRARDLLASGEIECDIIPGEVATIPVCDGRVTTFVSADGYRALMRSIRQGNAVVTPFSTAFVAAGRLP